MVGESGLLYLTCFISASVSGSSSVIYSSISTFLGWKVYFNSDLVSIFGFTLKALFFGGDSSSAYVNSSKSLIDELSESDSM